MCFNVDDRPPLPPIRGSALDSRDLTLTSSDGTRVAAFAAQAQQPSGAGIVIIPDVRGLHPYYEELALRFAEAGVHAVTFDLYSRTAGTGKRGDDFDPAAHMRQLTADGLGADVAAAAALLRSPDGGEPQRTYTVGFCVGGRISFLQAASGLGLDGVIGFYGPPVAEHRSGLPAPVDEAPRFSCPVLGLFGGADRSIPAEAREAFDCALTEAGVEHRFVVYDGAPHSFFDRKAEEFADASADAWRQMLDFMQVAVE
jgi:carboxymethylenebutenolidase